MAIMLQQHYFPLLVPECWLIEPTETETKQELDRFGCNGANS